MLKMGRRNAFFSKELPVASVDAEIGCTGRLLTYSRKRQQRDTYRQRLPARMMAISNPRKLERRDSMEQHKKEAPVMDQGRFGEDQKVKMSKNNQGRYGESRTGNTVKTELSESWVCPNDETVNTGDTCMICGCPRPIKTEERLEKVCEAYRAPNVEQRTCYDQFSSAGKSTRCAPSQIVPHQGEDVMTQLELSFNEAAFGCEKEVSIPRIENCPACRGTGGIVEICQQCCGTGQEVRTTRSFMSMRMQYDTVCSKCGGKGKIIKAPCNTCRGKGKVRRINKLKIKIPAGVDVGQSIRVRGEGCVSTNGGPNGNLLVKLHIRPHPLFRREGDDILCEVPISSTQAALGAKIQVPTLDGQVTCKIPKGTQSGQIFVLRNQGIPSVINPGHRGNLRFTVVVKN